MMATVLIILGLIVLHLVLNRIESGTAAGAQGGWDSVAEFRPPLCAHRVESRLHRNRKTEDCPARVVRMTRRQRNEYHRHYRHAHVDKLRRYNRIRMRKYRADAEWRSLVATMEADPEQRQRHWNQLYRRLDRAEEIERARNRRRKSVCTEMLRGIPHTEHREVRKWIEQHSEVLYVKGDRVLWRARDGVERLSDEQQEQA